MTFFTVGEVKILLMVVKELILDSSQETMQTTILSLQMVN